MRKYLLLFVLFTSCSSSKLINSFSTETANTYDIKKVLVVGITSQKKARSKFEKKLAAAFRDENIEAVASIKYFDPLFTISEKSEEDLQKLENHLLAEGYNAVILSKIVNIQNKVSISQSYKNLSGNYSDFKEDYYRNQGLYATSESPNSKIYDTETALYSLTKDKSRELLWRGTIDLVNPSSLESSVSNYVRLVVTALRSEGLLP